MKFFVALTTAALLTVASTSADARPKHHRSHHIHAAVAPAAAACVSDNNGRTTCSGAITPTTRAARMVSYSSGDMRVVGGRPVGCPHAYCGCETSIRIFGRIIPDLNLAANWRRFQPAQPAAGMAAWRSHHVFAIESVNSDGTVVAYNPNSGGHRTRIMTVSLRGYHVVNPHGTRLASR